MEKDINIKQQLAVWLAEPEKVTLQDAAMLRQLIDVYPYSQPLHLLLARATVGTAQENPDLATTALYTNGRLLRNFLRLKIKTDSAVPKTALEQHEHDIAEVDDQEVFDEIGEIDISNYSHTSETIHQKVPVPETAEQLIAEEEPEIKDDFIENIVSTDFFAFEENFAPEAPHGEKEQLKEEPTEKHQQNDVKKEDPLRVSKYDDDKLPYTFLWWLAKTRKEHQQIFQPYATAKSNPAPGELQQQYVEHIFHIQTPFNAEEHLNSGSDNLHAEGKGMKIIDNFIKKDPQILPPKPEQIDNENKAKKSAEDHNDVVSETLAKIYIEQMLYQKAIETYEKLSLKFPEKSRYFADLIQSIKKKI